MTQGSPEKMKRIVLWKLTKRSQQTYKGITKENEKNCIVGVDKGLKRDREPHEAHKGMSRSDVP